MVGPGRMGIGIAQAMAIAGHRVELIDVKDRSGDGSAAALAEAERQIATGLALLVSVGFLAGGEDGGARRRIAYSGVGSADEALARSSVVFEAVPEVVEAKETAYARIGAAAPEDALVGSTTSTFGVDDLSARVRRPARFMNTHWLNPATLMPIVEVMPSARTCDEAFDAMSTLLRDAGKVPIRCSASAGYIVPRIQAVAMNEAARLVEEGVADPETIDVACRLGFGVRFATMGLLEFVDWGGADILLYASNYLERALDSERYSPPAIVAEKVRSGALGLKSRRGFYDYDGRDLYGYQRETLRRLVELLRHMAVIR